MTEKGFYFTMALFLIISSILLLNHVITSNVFLSQQDLGVVGNLQRVEDKHLNIKDSFEDLYSEVLGVDVNVLSDRVLVSEQLPNEDVGSGAAEEDFNRFKEFLSLYEDGLDVNVEIENAVNGKLTIQPCSVVYGHDDQGSVLEYDPVEGCPELLGYYVEMDITPQPYTDVNWVEQHPATADNNRFLHLFFHDFFAPGNDLNEVYYLDTNQRNEVRLEHAGGNQFDFIIIFGPDDDISLAHRWVQSSDVISGPVFDPSSQIGFGPNLGNSFVKSREYSLGWEN